MLEEGARLAVLGLILGVAAALALGRLLTALLFGVTTTDPLTYLAVSLLLLIVALAAAVIPARRAALIDPTVALRYE